MLKVILTGATGMVGEGVLYECLHSPVVESVLIVNRKASGFSHTKLKEIVHADFFHLDPIADQLTRYNACFFCLGVSSVGMKEDAYRRMTYDLTMHFAQTVQKQNANMTFCYISGKSTDSSEKGRMMWARVKGKTENDLMKLAFKAVYNFRPGALVTHKGLKNTLPAYKYFSWMFPIVKLLAPNSISTLKELGLAMISAADQGYEKSIIEVSDIHRLASRER